MARFLVFTMLAQDIVIIGLSAVFVIVSRRLSLTRERIEDLERDLLAARVRDRYRR